MKTLCYLLLAIAVFTLHSCVTLTQEIYLKEDGSGEYVRYIEIDSTYSTYDELFAGHYSACIDSSQMNTPEAQEALSKLSEVLSAFQGEKIDEKMRDALRKEQRFSFRNMNELEFYTNKEKKEGKQGYHCNDKDCSCQNWRLPPSGIERRYKYKMKNGTFTRSTKFTGKQKAKENGNSLASLLCGAKIKTIVHMPGKIKEATGGTVLLLEGNKVVFEHPVTNAKGEKIPHDFKIVME